MKFLPTGSGRHTLDGSFWGSLAQALMVPTGLATVAYLTRTLGPTGYGQYAVVITLIAWVEFGIVAMFGRPTVKFVAEAEDWRPVATTVMQAAVLVGVGVMLALWVGADLIAGALAAPELAWPVRLAAIDIPLFVAGQAHLNILVGLGRFRHRALAGALRWVTRLLLIVVLVESGGTLWGAIGGCIGASVAEVLVCRLFCRPSWFGRTAFGLRRLWGYVVPLFLATISLRVLDGLDLVVLRLLGGTAEQAGLYAAALNLALLPAVVAAAINPVLLSSVSRLRHAGEVAQAKELGRGALRGVLVLVPVAALVAGAATEMARLVFGPDFAAAGPLLAVLILAGMGRLLILVAEAILTASGRPGATVRVTGPLVPLTLAGHALLIPWLGPLGAALATVSACGLAALACVGLLYRLEGIAPPQDTFVRAAVLSALSFTAAALWPTPGWLVLLKLPVLSGGIAVAFLLLGECDARERALLGSLFRRRSVSLQGAGEAS
jgi:O-antigen/teichoic acid export membrane protein